jgi:hypothetical protein
MISAHGTPYSPAGYCFLRVPGMTTARSGTSPRYSLGSAPVTSMIGTVDVSTTFAPSTASLRTRTPSTITQRDPTNTPSSTITGRADGGSSTPPIPTPPARCTSRPICAHDPTVAQVSTIELAPTRAPMFT